MSDPREQAAVDAFLAVVARAAARGAVQAGISGMRLVDLLLVAARLKRISTAGSDGNDDNQATDKEPL